MEKVVIYGVGKMAEFIYYSFHHDSNFDVVAFCAGDAFLTDAPATLFDLPVLSFSEILQQFPPDHYFMHIAIGRNSARESIFRTVLDAGYRFANYICSKASVWPDLVIGRNVFIDQSSVAQPFVTIGDNCMLIGAQIGHHCRIGNNALLSGCSLAGSVTIGDNAFLGLNSSVKEGISIGNHTIIGAGCFISKPIKDGTLIYQERARQREAGSRNIVLFNNTRTREQADA